MEKLFLAIVFIPSVRAMDKKSESFDELFEQSIVRRSLPVQKNKPLNNTDESSDGEIENDPQKEKDQLNQYRTVFKKLFFPERYTKENNSTENA